jgi:hypothetical protein
VACIASARDFSMGPESSEIFSASAAGLDTSSTGNRWLSKVNVPVSEGESAKHDQIREVEAYEASRSEGRRRADIVLCNQIVPA